MARREFTTRCAICGLKLDGDPYTRALLPGKKRLQRAHLRCLDRLQQLGAAADACLNTPTGRATASEIRAHLTQSALAEVAKDSE